MKAKDFFDSLSDNEITLISQQNLDSEKVEYEEFKTAFERGVCYMCDMALEKFSSSRPCLHWLLRPKGIKKYHIKQVFVQGKGFFPTTTYLRWVANLTIPIGNIGNLKEEIDPNRKLELTIKYKNLEWSFSSSFGDFSGHLGASGDGERPHYHFQMLIDRRIFFKFNDHHPRFSDKDMFTFDAMEAFPDSIIAYGPHAFGIQEMLDNLSHDELLEGMKPTEDSEHAPFHLQTLILAPEGGMLREDDIADLIQESRAKGVPIAKLAKGRFANTFVQISPGEGIPIIAQRTKTRGK